MSLEEKVKELMVNEDKIKNYFFVRDSEEYRKIKSPDLFIDDTIKYFTGEIQSGAYLPFEKAENFRLRLGETTIWSGYSGHGKSMLLSYITLKLFENYKTIFLGTDNNKFNKNIILLSIREMTNLSTKEIRTAMKRFKKLYYVVLNKIIE